MAKLNAERDVKPELAVINGRMTNEKLQLRELGNGWALVDHHGEVVINGTLREMFNFILGAKYITERE